MKKFSTLSKEVKKCPECGKKPCICMKEEKQEEGEGEYLNLGGKKIKNSKEAVLAHVTKTFPNAKSVKKVSNDYGPGVE